MRKAGAGGQPMDVNTPIAGKFLLMSEPDTDVLMMRRALELAEKAASHDDVPIGAVVARGDEVLGQAGNERELRRDPTAHAEVLALREAAERLGGWRLLETTLYVTLEPCPMCAGAITLARVPRLVFGAADPKGGAVGSVIDLFSEPVVNHRPAVESGLLGAESAALLEGFFSARR
jgi:tRNA(adenine34) deaminase